MVLHNGNLHILDIEKRLENNEILKIMENYSKQLNLGINFKSTCRNLQCISVSFWLCLLYTGVFSPNVFFSPFLDISLCIVHVVHVCTFHGRLPSLLLLLFLHLQHLFLVCSSHKHLFVFKLVALLLSFFLDLFLRSSLILLLSCFCRL